jgi:hypothetical protein
MRSLTTTEENSEILEGKATHLLQRMRPNRTGSGRVWPAANPREDMIEMKWPRLSNPEIFDGNWWNS